MEATRSEFPSLAISVTPSASKTDPHKTEKEEEQDGFVTPKGREFQIPPITTPWAPKANLATVEKWNPSYICFLNQLCMGEKGIWKENEWQAASTEWRFQP